VKFEYKIVKCETHDMFMVSEKMRFVICNSRF